MIQVNMSKKKKIQAKVVPEFSLKEDYPFGYMSKPNLRKRHPSGYVADYKYE